MAPMWLNYGPFIYLINYNDHTMNNTRRYTRYALELADNGILSWEQLAESCLYYMSEDDVYRMIQANDMLPEQTEFEDNV